MRVYLVRRDGEIAGYVVQMFDHGLEAGGRESSSIRARASPRSHAGMVERAVALTAANVMESWPYVVYHGRARSPDRYGKVLPTTGPADTVAHDTRAAIVWVAASFRVSPAVVRRVRRDLAAFCRSPLYRQKAARYDALATRDETHLL